MDTVKTFIILLLLGVMAAPVHSFSASSSHDHQHHEARKDRHRDRYQWQLPVRVMDEIGIRQGMVVADVGAGDGYFTFRLSQRVGAGGRVFASDIDDHALQAVRDRCRKEGIKNISVVRGKEDDPLLPERQIDVVLMVNTIHLVARPRVFLKNISRSLKPEGILVLVQWEAEKMGREHKDWDPEDRKKYTLRTNLRTIYTGGFEVIRILDFLPVQTIYICRPAGE